VSHSRLCALASGGVSPRTRVWTEGMADWAELKSTSLVQPSPTAQMLRQAAGVPTEQQPSQARAVATTRLLATQATLRSSPAGGAVSPMVTGWPTVPAELSHHRSGVGTGGLRRAMLRRHLGVTSSERNALDELQELLLQFDVGA
jgi:hypothetical protein